MEVETLHRIDGASGANLASQFAEVAGAQSNRVALALPGRGRQFVEVTFGELDAWSDGYADGLRRAGLAPGDRALLLMRPGAEFMALALGLLKAGIVGVLVDPGMDRASLLRCIERAAPKAMIGAPPAHLLAAIARHTFATVEKRWLAGWPWAPAAVERLRRQAPGRFAGPPTSEEAIAAIVFTTGSTGTPKGVVYTHGNYLAQFDALRRRFGIGLGDVALPGYLTFALLCLCLGSTCVVPRVHPARPASVDPGPVLECIRTYRPSYGLGSPAFWARIAEYCARTGDRLNSVRLLLLFGAEVHESILRALRDVLPDGAVIHTPYGATEAQPITTISDRELLEPALAEQRAERGVCVGLPIDGVTVQLVRVTDDPLDSNELQRAFAPGEIGEVTVRGPMVTSAYFRQPREDRLHKIRSGSGVWHRMGDCGSFDERGRLWLAGRKAERIETAGGTLFPLHAEAHINKHPGVRRCALVGIGPRGEQRPVLIVEPLDSSLSTAARAALITGVAARAADHPATRGVRDVLVHPSLPVDYRHNAKIQRDVLARWAAATLQQSTKGGVV